MSNYIVDGSDLTSVADAIRSKSGGSSALAFPAGFVSEIGAIETGGGYTAEDWLDTTKPSGAIVSDILLTNRSTTNLLRERSGITSVLLPEAEYIPAYSFIGCTGILWIRCVKATGFGASALMNCTKLQTAVFPSAQFNGASIFQGCSKLVSVDAGGNFSNSNIFLNCSKLNVIVNRKSTLATLSAIGVFGGTPFASGKAGGTLYVPQALISEYQSATNWSTILGYANNQILPIEGSIYETQYVDGTPIE